MIINIYRDAWRTMMKRPVKLWGLSLLSVLLCSLIALFGVNIPIVTIPVTAVITAGMSVMFLDGYRGREVSSEQLFDGFKNFKHTAGGMCWKILWIFIWSLIPAAGIVLGIVKSIAYLFTPYILLEQPNISATEALRESIRRTKGIKGQIFVAVLLPVVAFALVFTVFALLAFIPVIGSFFATIDAIITIVYLLFIRLFLGLVTAGFYDIAKNR